jgi:hypothetical protein
VPEKVLLSPRRVVVAPVQPVQLPTVRVPMVAVLDLISVVEALVAKKFVVVAEVPVAFTKVKFWSVEEPIAKRLITDVRPSSSTSNKTVPPENPVLFVPIVKFSEVELLSESILILNEFVVLMNPLVRFPRVSTFGTVREPILPVVEKRFVLDAVVEKKFVLVALVLVELMEVKF